MDLRNNKTLRFSLIVLGIILLLIVLYPKESGQGYPASIWIKNRIYENKSFIRYEQSCIGFEYSNSDRWGVPCQDCTLRDFCIGIDYDKSCYKLLSYEPLFEEINVPCETNK